MSAMEGTGEERVFGPRLDRLERLLAHMEGGELSVDRFFFGVFRDDLVGCGTMGCMAGELPFLWPEEWEWCEARMPRLKVRRGTFGEDAGEWFGISAEELARLFFPGASRLGVDATREAVAGNLRRLIVEKKESFKGTQEARDRMREARERTEATCERLRDGAGGCKRLDQRDAGSP